MTIVEKLSYVWMHKEDPEFKKTILNNSNNSVLVKLKSILKDKLSERLSQRIIRPDYQDSSWMYVQSDLNGETRTYSTILELLNFVEDKK